MTRGISKHFTKFILSLLLITSCNRDDSLPSHVNILYEIDFLNGNGGWGTALINSNINEINLNDIRLSSKPF